MTLRKRKEFDIKYDEEKGKIVILDRQADKEYTVAIELVFTQILGMRVGEAVLATQKDNQTFWVTESLVRGEVIK